MRRASSAECWADDLTCTRLVALDFLRLKHDIPPQQPPHRSPSTSRRQFMTDPNRQNDDPVSPAQAGEPVVSKPYIMPDDPEAGSTEALAKEAAELRDKVLRTLAEMENLRKRTTREVADARVYGIPGFAPDGPHRAENVRRAPGAVAAGAKGAAHAG